MKNFTALVCVLLFTFALQAQGTIIGFTMSPVSPTVADTIYIYADIRFTSSSCELSDQSQTQSGAGIQATAHHCLGVATAICAIVDTFKIDPLPNGNYNFNLNLTSGIAPAPCTAGIGADDDSTFSFTVGPGSPAGLNDENLAKVIIYPNPVKNQIILPTVNNGTKYSIIDISGKVVRSGIIDNNTITNLEALSTGLYFLKLQMSNGELVRRIVRE